jgi:hypothetical protein
MILKRRELAFNRMQAGHDVTKKQLTNEFTGLQQFFFHVNPLDKNETGDPAISFPF